MRCVAWSAAFLAVLWFVCVAVLPCFFVCVVCDRRMEQVVHGQCLFLCVCLMALLAGVVL